MAITFDNKNTTGGFSMSNQFGNGGFVARDLRIIKTGLIINHDAREYTDKIEKTESFLDDISGNLIRADLNNMGTIKPYEDSTDANFTLDGVDDWINCNRFDISSYFVNGNKFSVFIWCKVQKYTSTIITNMNSSEDPAESYPLIQYDDSMNQLYFYVRNDIPIIYTYSAENDYVLPWLYLGITYTEDSGVLNAYVNGNNINQLTDTYGDPPRSYFGIGNESKHALNDGIIPYSRLKFAAFQLYDRKLNDEEVYHNFLCDKNRFKL